jgi:hypothetical protein
MKASKGYNGFKNYNQWNISLWINNDEVLYRMAKEYIGTYKRNEAAQAMLDDLREYGITHTQDGVKWSKAGILAAMVGM